MPTEDPRYRGQTLRSGGVRLTRRTVLQTAAALGCGAIIAPDSDGAVTIPHRSPLHVSLIDASKFTTDERFTAAAIQGLVNRGGPRVFLNYGGSLAFTRFNFHLKPGQAQGTVGWDPTVAANISRRYHATDDFWIADLTRRGLFRFEPCTVEHLVSLYAADIKGLIIYHNINDDLAVAATMAGLRDAVPVTPLIRRKWFSHLPHPVPEIFDVGTLYARYDHRWPKRIGAHRWAIAHLLPKCSRIATFSRILDYGMAAADTLPDVDLAIQQRWFTFTLNYGNSIAHPTHNSAQLRDIDMEGRLIDKIFNHLHPWAPVYGWGGPGEDTIVSHISRRGHVMLCTANGNGTFYKGLPVLAKCFGQPGDKRPAPTLSNKIYLALMIAEGDTLKCLTSLENGGSWIQPERGRFPINWGMDPLLYREFPGLVSYYYKTASPRDYFFAAASCWGYAHPDAMPDKLIIPYANLISQGLRQTGLTIGDIWWDGSLKRRGLWEAFIKASGLRGVTQWSDGYQSVEYVGTVPVAYSPYYYKLENPAHLAAHLVAQEKQISSPWFVVIYAGNPYLFEQLIKHLPKNRFEPLRLDDFFTLMGQARPKVEHLRWQQGRMIRNTSRANSF